MVAKHDRLKPSTRREPCPICNDIKGKCRSAGDLVLCMTADGPILQYKYIGRTKDNLWAKYLIGQNSNGPSPSGQAVVAKSHLAHIIPIDTQARNYWYKHALNQLLLTKSHKADLIRRGYTDEQIKKYGFKSISKEPLDHPVPDNLPGFTKGKYLPRYEGYLIPIFNDKNHIVGCQVRLDKSDQKYRWLSNPNNPVHICCNNDKPELPLAFCKPDHIKLSGVALCESVGHKPRLISIHTGQIVIGASGGNFTSGSSQLLHYLANYHPDKNLPVVLYADAGSLENDHIFRQYQELNSLLDYNGYVLNVAWYGQFSKHNNLDPDELIVSGRHSEIKLITWQEFSFKYSIAANYYNKLKSFTPDVVLHQKYLDAKSCQLDRDTVIAKNQTDNRYIVAIKSPMGTGKTEILKQLVDTQKELGIGGILHGTRNSLLMQTCKRIGAKHLNLDNSQDAIFIDESWLANCFNSLIKWYDKSLENRSNILDETSSAIDYLLTAVILKKVRIPVLKKLQYALQNAKTIILLDANLSDWQVEFIRQLANIHTDNIIKVCNQYQTTKRITICQDKDLKPMLTKVCKDISLSIIHKEPIAILTDSQKLTETLETYAINQGVPDISIMRVDSKTCSLETVRNFLDNPSDYIELNKPLILLVSPTAESGLSIDSKDYFKRGYFIRYHLPTDNAVQMLGRLRDPDINWLVYSKKFTNGITETLNSPLGKQLDINLRELVNATLNTVSSKDIRDKLIQNINDYFDSPYHDAWLKNQAIKNYENKHLRDTLISSIRGKGWELTEIELTLDDTDFWSDYLDAKDEVGYKYAKAIFDANINGFTHKDALRIETSWGANPDDRIKARKYILLNKLLPGVENTPIWSIDFIKLIEYDDKSLLDKLRKRWYLANPDKLEATTYDKFEKLAKQDDIFMPDNLRSPILLNKALLESHIDELINLGKLGTKFTKDHEIVKKVLSKARRRYKRLGHLPDDNIKAINKLLALLGYKLIGRSQRINSEKVICSYQLVDIYSDYQSVVLSCFDCKFNDWRRFKDESLTRQGLESVKEPHDVVIPNGPTFTHSNSCLVSVSSVGPSDSAKMPITDNIAVGDRVVFATDNDGSIWVVKSINKDYVRVVSINGFTCYHTSRSQLLRLC